MSDRRRRFADPGAWLETHPWVLPLATLIAGGAFRFYNLNWDNGHQLHPDERWIYMVLSGPHGNPPSPALQWPASIGQFFSTNPTTGSPLDPHFFAYGSLPFYLLGLLAGGLSLLGQHVPLLSGLATVDSYDMLPGLGRGFSAALDLSAVLLIFLLGRKVYGYWVGVLAMALTAFTVLDIQLSHFFAVDTVLLPITLLTLLASVEIAQTGSRRAFVLGGIALGAAMATKTTGLLLVVPLGAAAVLGGWTGTVRLGRRLPRELWSQYRGQARALNGRLLWLLGLYLLAALTFMVCEPYAVLDRGTLVSDIATQTVYLVTNNPPFSVPFTIQYANTTPYVYQFANLLFWGFGIPLGIAAFGGVLWVLVRTLRLRVSRPEAVLLLWVVPYFLFVGRFFAKFDRYMLPITAVMVLFGAALLTALVRRLRGRFRAVAWAAIMAVTGVSFLYSLAYMNIYAAPNTRVAASRWMFHNIPAHTTIAEEGNWDDLLPLNELGMDGSIYTLVSMNLYDGELAPTDQALKIKHITQALTTAQYLIMTSERMIGSIPKLPDQYPLTVRYYQLLFSNKLNFRLYREFQAHPQLGPFVVHDYSADESFHVYDHPLVRIFKRIGPISPALVKTLLTTGLPVVTAAAPPGQAVSSILRPVLPPADTRLMLTKAQWTQDQNGPTYSQMFPLNGLGMQHPLVVWFLLLELLGLLTIPLVFVVFRNLLDRGFVIGKTIGLLLLGYLVWMAVNVHLAVYDRTAIGIALLIMLLCSAAGAYRLRAELRTFIRTEWRRILLGEAVFVVGFAIALALRLYYPDLGHQWSPAANGNMGGGQMGEKQMELAFLNAIVRSRVFPPFDPFFAHGYINYYYYGLYLVGTLCKLTGIAPATGFNLAIATFFGMLLANTWSAVLSLTRRVWPALVAATFVGLIGNLDGAAQLLSGLMSVSTVHSGFPVLGGVLDVLSGTQAAVFSHTPLPAFNYWNSRSLFPHAINEFPYFTYLFADLHPHLIAYPMTVAVVAFAVNLLRGGYLGVRSAAIALLTAGLLLGGIAVTNPWDFPTYLLVLAFGAALGQFVLTRRLGWRPARWAALWLSVPAGVSYLLYLPFKRGYQTVFETGVGLTRDVPIQAIQNDVCNPPVTNCAAAVHDVLVSPLHLYLEHFGLFAFLIASYLVLLLFRDTGLLRIVQRTATAARFALYYREHLGQLPRRFRVARRMTTRPTTAPVDGSLALGVLLLVVGLLALQYFLLAFLAAVSGLLVLTVGALGRRLEAHELFALGLIAIGVLLSAGTQIFFVKDFLAVGASFRMNTIFKFYDEVWVLFAIGTSTILPVLFRRVAAAQNVSHPRSDSVATRPQVLPGSTAAPAPAAGFAMDALGPGGTTVAFEAGSGNGDGSPTAAVAAPARAGAHSLSRLARRLFIPEPASSPPSRVRTAWTVAFTLLLAGSAIYTLAGTQGRESLRSTWLPSGSVPLTLDGMAFMKAAYPNEYAAITWLNNNVHGAQVTTEAAGAYYDWRSRVSMFTGLPSIFNGIHEGEQRFADEIDPTALCGMARNPSYCQARLHARKDDANRLYDSSSVPVAWSIIREYGVRYIYLGFAERQCIRVVSQCYSKAGLAKFNRMVGHGLRVAFRQGDVTIYQVTRA